MSERICRSCGQILKLKNKLEYVKTGKGLKRFVYYCNNCSSNLNDKQRTEMFLKRTVK